MVFSKKWFNTALRHAQPIELEDRGGLVEVAAAAMGREEAINQFEELRTFRRPHFRNSWLEKNVAKIVFANRIWILKVLTFAKSVCDWYLHQTVKKVAKTKKRSQYAGHVSGHVGDRFGLKSCTR